MKLAIVGVTGLVGGEIMEVLNEFNFDIDTFIPVASERSVGKKINFRDGEHTIVSMDDAVSMRPDIAIFSAGGSTSLEHAPKFAEAGTIVIDNSSAWRMDKEKLLIVPEINAHLISADDKIIANPNCSTIQMVVALAPLHAKYGIKRLVISTYQSFTGTGVKAVRQYETEKEGNSLNGESAYPHPIFANCLPHCDIFLDNGYTKEEMKLVHETHKILGDETIGITATAVRVPVFGGHSESINVELGNDFEINEVIELLKDTKGLIVQDDVDKNVYPMPLAAHKKNEVFVGRIRKDESNPRALNLWVVADNLRKGAATNAVQIAEHIRENKLVPVN